jgi:GTPase SAR1 family protein
MVSAPLNKLILVGSAGSGKTAIINRFLSGSYSPEYVQTFGAELFTKTSSDQRKPSLHIWATSGQERYRTLFGQFYQDATVGISE